MSIGKGLTDYFDLNRDLKKYRSKEKKSDDAEDEIAEELHVALDSDSSPHRISKTKAGMPLCRQLFMYFGTFLGVFFSLTLTQFESGELTLNISPIKLVISAAIALIIIPLVYKKLDLNRGSPAVVQFGLFFQNGFFWHVLINAIGKIM